MDVEPLGIALLCAAALVAGTVDAIGGGGGLIALPALLAVGLPPEVAIPTNKGQSAFGTFAALLRYGHAGLLQRGRAAFTFPAGLAGSAAGALLLGQVDKGLLRPIVLVLLLGVAAFLAFRPRARDLPRLHPPGRARWIAVAIALVVGTYDGFFGPGTGTFLIVAFVMLLHEPESRATADAKVVNFASNLAAMGVFAAQGRILWHLALPMAACQLVGGFLGAHLTVRGGDRLVRRVVFLVVAGTVAKLAWDFWAD